MRSFIAAAIALIAFGSRGAFADAGRAAVRGGFLVFRRLVAFHRLFERRKLDHDEAMKAVGALHDLELAAASEHLAAVVELYLNRDRQKPGGQAAISAGAE